MTRTITSFAVLAAVLAFFVLLGIGTGSSFIAPDRVLATLAGNGERTETIIVWTLRMPRVLLAVLAGAALAVAGALLQRATRNPLASPSVLGVVDGAALGVLVFLFAFSDESNIVRIPIAWQPAFAVAGASVFAAAVALLARHETASPMRLVLYGVSMALLANAIVILMMIIGPVYRSSQALIWLAGSVHQAEWSDISLVAWSLLPTLPLLALALSPADQLGLDDTSAHATGLAVAASRALLLCISVYLTAVAVSVAGGIGFVGLIAPHAARLVFGPRASLQFAAAAMIGASIVAGADILVRTLFQPLEVPTGAVTAMLGAPYFLFLLTRRGHAHA